MKNLNVEVFNWLYFFYYGNEHIYNINIKTTVTLHHDY